GENRTIERLASDEAQEFLGEHARVFAEEIELVKGATHSFDREAYRAGRQTPVFFGSAINNFGIEELLRSFRAHAPCPLEPAARWRARHASAACSQRRKHSPASCSRSRRTWTPGIAIASRSCGCAPGATRAACGFSRCGSTRRCAWPMRLPSWRPIACRRRK